MKSLRLFLAIPFSLFFLLNTSAQTVVLKGLVTEEIKTKEGKVTVYLPDDIRPGDIISGTVVAEPDGKNEKEKRKNGEQLGKYKITVAGSTISLSGFEPQRVKILSAPTNPVIILLDEKNNPVSTINVNVSPRIDDFQPKSIMSPTHALTASPLRITGPFDGDASNTKCKLDGKEMEILAESPRQTICTMPAATSGPHTLTVEEKGETTEKKISAVNLDLTTGRLNLQRGEKTYVDVSIAGLQNLPSNATLTVTNTTTGVVTMLGGENQVLSILPAAITGEGTFNKRFDLQSTKTGSFSVDVNLQLPDSTEAGHDGSITQRSACNLTVTTCILPGTTCAELQKGMAEKLVKDPLLQTNQPEDSPYYSTNFRTNFTGDYINSSLSSSITNTFTDQVVFTFEKITSDYKTKKEKNETREWVLDKDTIAAGGFSTQTPVFRFDPGLYHFRATAYYGSNQTYVHNAYVAVPQQRNPPTVSNPEIERLRKEEQRLRDSINAINRRIENGVNHINDNYKRRHYLDSLQWIQSTLYNQLHQIDNLIEQIPGEYGGKLQNLLDSLERFQKKAGSLDPAQLQAAADRMQQEVNDLEAALKACLDHLAALQKEQQDLQNEKDQIQKDQEQAYHDILDACRDAGYNAGGSSGRNSTSGQFSYNYGLILRGDNGELEFVRGIPAQALKKVSDLEKKIKAGNNRIKEINARQKELPGEIDKAKKECDDISARLAKAKEALRKGANNVIEYNYNMADLDELCSQIKNLLEPLAAWCKQHPGECGPFESQLKQLMDDCPQNLTALPNLMNSLGNIIAQKKQAEQNHKKQADDLGRQIDGINNDNQATGTAISNDQNKAEGYGSDLDKNNQAQDKAIADEIANRQQEEAAKTAARKRVCIEFLKSQAKSEEEAGLIDQIAAIKDQIQGMAENVKTASEIGDKLTKDKLKELTDKLREGIDKMLEQFEKFDKLKGKIDEWAGIKQDLETLMNSDGSAKAAADKMGVILKRINEQLQKVSKEFPILQLFTAYFGFMVDAYNTIITGAYKAVTGEIVYYMEQALRGKLNCESLVNEYQKRNSLDDAVRKADEICRRDEAFMIAKVNNAEKQRIYEEELKKYVLKLMMDCCLRYAMQ
ncbi:MAG: hypothetical protein ACHQEB_06935 [Chitinophagales bacterium]